jgi:hypothetical protein
MLDSTNPLVSPSPCLPLSLSPPLLLSKDAMNRNLEGA